MSQRKSSKGRARAFFMLCLMGVFIYLTHFNSEFFDWLYGREGLLVIEGGWWLRNLVVAIPLVILSLGWVAIRLFFKGPNWNLDYNLTGCLFFVVTLVFTMSTSQFDLNFGQSVLRYGFNILVMKPGLFLWAIISAYKEPSTGGYMNTEKYRLPMGLTDNQNLHNLINDKFIPKD